MGFLSLASCSDGFWGIDVTPCHFLMFTRASQAGGLFLWMDMVKITIKIDVDKLTKEAEAGHGRYVGSILEQMPFEEQIHIAHEMEKLSKKHSNDYSLPQIEFVMYRTSRDEESRFGYDAVRLYRTIPDKHFGTIIW